MRTKHRCRAVRGCKSTTVVLNFKAGRRTVKACAMHRKRWERNGHFGGSRPKAIGASTSASAKRRAREQALALYRTRHNVGSDRWELTTQKGGSGYRICARSRVSLRSVLVANRAVHSWTQRGWLKIGKLQAHVRFADVTRAGRKQGGAHAS